MATRTYPPGTVQMRPMLDGLARNWWLILLRGILAVIFGLLTFAWPGLTLFTLVMFYGAYALVDGVFSLAAAVTKGPPAPRWWLAIVGLLGIGAGIVTLMWPQVTGIALLYLIAAWAIVSGVFQIIGAFRLRKEIEDEWLLALSGLVSVVFGALILANPGAGALGVAFAIGAFAVLFGVLQIALSLRLKKMADVKI